MIRAYYETRNFIFDAYADTEKEAERLMIKLWKDHCINRKVSYNDFPKYIDDIEYTEVYVGAKFIDNEPVK